MNLVKLLSVSLLLTSVASDSCERYFKVGAGYKFQEPKYLEVRGEEVRFDFGSNPSARAELGCDYKSWSFGISHHSQWFDFDSEYYKTEVFLDYKFLF
jgi:hypothetical protein